MTHTTAALWYFESVDLYKILCPHKVKRMHEMHKFISFKRDQFVYMTDDPASYVYLVASGRVRLGHYLENGNEVTTAILSQGEIFGELAMAGEVKRRDFAQAMESATICPLTTEQLKELMYENKDLSFKILKLIGLRLMKLERKLELLVFKDARTRIVEFLKDMASWKGTKVGYETLIPMSLSHKDIAALTGTSRQTVNAILNGLKEANQINFNRRQILIRDIETLR
ncbi:MAG TPA: Crp/Fnr family transcriptional regulator [Chryseolinea sp.]|nr:Crp/Fnr family transcriptional regulator [Chryseolinea sp.]